MCRILGDEWTDHIKTLRFIERYIIVPILFVGKIVNDWAADTTTTAAAAAAAAADSTEVASMRAIRCPKEQ